MDGSGINSVCSSIAVIPTLKYNLSTDPSENVRLVLTTSDQSATIACAADGRPEPSFKIFFNCDMSFSNSLIIHEQFSQ